mmetsp:Transcript_33814/g.72079  ORF Transcript_33814/g.72079 Transcript_33814/m.72079 type:complete len:207 (+) Transcript_33814:416-1036(+)
MDPPDVERALRSAPQAIRPPPPEVVPQHDGAEGVPDRRARLRVERAAVLAGEDLSRRRQDDGRGVVEPDVLLPLGAVGAAADAEGQRQHGASAGGEAGVGKIGPRHPDSVEHTQDSHLSGASQRGGPVRALPGAAGMASEGAAEGGGRGEPATGRAAGAGGASPRRGVLVADGATEADGRPDVPHPRHLRRGPFQRDQSATTTRNV